MDKLSAFTVLCCACVAMAIPPDFWPTEYERSPLGDNIDVVTMKLLKARYDHAENKSIVMSPISALMLLMLYDLGSGPTNKGEINKLMGEVDSRNETNSFKELMLRYTEMNPNHLVAMTKIYYAANEYYLDEDYIQALRVYDYELDSVVYYKPEEVVAKIKKWSAEYTMNEIKDPVNTDRIKDGLALTLVAAISFNGKWQVPFKPEETKEKDFHVSSDKVVKIPMMHLFQSMHYTQSETLGAKIIGLPYKKKDFRMIVVIPNEMEGLPSVLEKAAQKGLLSDVFRLTPAEFHLELDMPKFDIRTKMEYTDILPQIGISKVFSEAVSGILQRSALRVSEVFQETFIKVDEEGVSVGTFSGVTAVNHTVDVVPAPQMNFTVNYPFLYAILHKDRILFAGTFSA